MNIIAHWGCQFHPSKGISGEIVPFEDGNGRENSPERGMRMGTVIYSMSRRDSVPENFIKVTFVNVYLRTL
jgi:hypothetical protein